MSITFSKSFDPDQAQCYVRPDLGPKFLTLMVFLKENMKMFILKKICRMTLKHTKSPCIQRGTCNTLGYNNIRSSVKIL